MRLFIRHLFSDYLTAASGTKIYTVPPSHATIVRNIAVFNEDTVNRTVTMRLHKADGSGYAVISPTTLKSKHTWLIPVSHTMEAGDWIEAFADVGAKVTVKLNGVEEVVDAV